MPSPVAVITLFVAAFAVAEPVSFRSEVAPILQQRCVACHGEDKAKGSYRLDTFEALAKPGDSGETPFTAGEPAKSTLHSLLIASDKDERMPQKSDALPADEIALIQRWITEGAKFDGESASQPLAELARGIFLRPAPATYSRPVPVTALAFNGDGRFIAVGGYREVLIYRTEGGVPPKRVGNLPERITSLAWSAKTNQLVVAGGTPGRWGCVALVDASNGYKVRILCDLPEQVLSVAVSRDGTKLVAGCGDKTVRFFDLPSGAPTRLLRPHADWVQSVALNRSGSLVVSTSRDRTARTIDPSTGEIENIYRAHEAALLCAEFSADGSRIYSTARGGSGHVWMPDTAVKRGDFKDFPGDAEKLAVSPLGVAAGCSDGAVRLYQPGDSTPYFTFRGHHAPVQSFAASRDGEWLASGSADGEVILWSPACANEVRRFRAQP